MKYRATLTIELNTDASNFDHFTAAASALGASFLAAVLVDFLATARTGVFAERIGSSRDLPAAALREVRAVFDLVMVQNFL